ncbi:MFS general substrate transporter [Rickenella mellea]|uniref:MFS general substrate transporter n=1 Tax=Rickenella mellea TaxID=50990 RepID=A0A4Y7PW55_9AGAM|nr:MFS general substrate transporter [Rickenella mellea]
MSSELKQDRSSIDKEKDLDTPSHNSGAQHEHGEIDFDDYMEQNAGSLVIDPAEARREFGDAAASKLKLSRDGNVVLWPQPTDDPEDPQNWSDRRKLIHLLIITMAAFVPDFDSAIGIAGIFALAKQYNTTTGVINNLTSNWSIFLIGWGGIACIMIVRIYGRLPILFWSQLIALGFLVGCTFAPSLSTFAAFRCLTGFFGTAAQVTGLYIVTDMYPFHLQARQINIWTMGFLVSPFVSPFALGFLVPRASWRWAYGVGCIYSVIVLLLIVFLMDETQYDRHLKPQPPRQSSGVRYRIETLVGITGARMAKYRMSWTKSFLSPFTVVWRPHLLAILVFEAMVFGFAIGINVTNAVFLGTPPPIGYGLKPDAIAGAYATPIVSVIIGELIGRYANDFIMNVGIRRNHGVFEAEVRLWACYIGTPLFACGFLALGGTLQHKASLAGIFMGWGIAQVGIMVNTVAVYAYCNDCFPKHQGEISALINLARILGGFSVGYYQVPWAAKHGALQVFACETAIVVGLFVIIVPFLQWKGKALRHRYSL